MPMIACPECSKGLKFPDDIAPRKVKCPNCEHVFMSSDAEIITEKKGSMTGKSGAGFEVIEDDEDEDTPKKKSSSKSRDDDDDDEDETPKKKKSSSKKDDDDDWADDDDEDDTPKKKKSSSKRRDDEDDEDDRPKKKKKKKKSSKSQDREDYDDDDAPEDRLTKQDYKQLKLPALGAMLNSITGFAVAGAVVLMILYLLILWATFPSPNNREEGKTFVDVVKVIRFMPLFAGFVALMSWGAGFVGIGGLFAGPKKKMVLIFAGGAALFGFLHGVLLLVTAIFPAYGSNLSVESEDNFTSFFVSVSSLMLEDSSRSKFRFWSISWTRLISEINILPDFTFMYLGVKGMKLGNLPTSKILAMLNGFFEAGRWVFLFLAYRALFKAGRDSESAKFATKGAIIVGSGIVALGIFGLLKAGIFYLMDESDSSKDLDMSSSMTIGIIFEVLTWLLVGAAAGFAGYYFLKIRKLVQTL